MRAAILTVLMLTLAHCQPAYAADARCMSGPEKTWLEMVDHVGEMTFCLPRYDTRGDEVPAKQVTSCRIWDVVSNTQRETLTVVDAFGGKPGTAHVVVLDVPFRWTHVTCRWLGMPAKYQNRWSVANLTPELRARVNAEMATFELEDAEAKKAIRIERRRREAEELGITLEEHLANRKARRQCLKAERCWDDEAKTCDPCVR